MTDTPRTGLEFVDAGTTDIDQPVNNNALVLDAVVGMNVVSATTTAEPTLTSPTDDGKVYILPAGRTGTNWAAQAVGTIAQWYSGTWYFYAPWAGLQARAADTGIRYQYTTSWAVWASVDAQLLLTDTDVPRLGTANDWAATQNVTGQVRVGGAGASLGFTPAYTADIDDATAIPSMVFVRYANSANSGFISGYKTRGTKASPSQTLSGDTLFDIRGSGYTNAAAFAGAQAASIQLRATENFTSTANGTEIVFANTAAGSTTSTVRWSVRSDSFRPVADNTYDFGTTVLRVKADHVFDRNTYGAEYHTGEQAVSLTANTDNQTVNSTSRVLRIASTGAYNLTGLTGGAAGRRLTLLNTSAFTITLTHDVTSTAANRFFCPNNASVLVRQNGSVEAIYDATSSRWRVIGA